MTKTIEQLTHERDDLEIGNTHFSCHNCGNFIDRVYFQDDSWPYCPSCGWNRNHVLSELDRVGIRVV